MSDAISLTKGLVRKELDVNIIVPQEINPNKMSPKEFNLLCDNLSQVGFVDPVFVRPIEDGKYRVIGGFHRLEAAKVLGFEEVPCTIVTDPDFTDDLERYQITRMNMIHGKMQPAEFLKLYESISEKYEADIMAEAFGFTDEAEFKRLINQFASSLPKNKQADFKKAAKEIKTIDGLSILLNKMFNMHGDSLPYGYMIVDFGGKESVWVQLENKDHKNLTKVIDMTVAKNKGVDALFKVLLGALANGEMQEVYAQLEDFPDIQQTEEE